MKPVRTRSDGTEWVAATISVPKTLYDDAKQLQIPLARTFREAVAAKIVAAREA